MIAVMKPGSVIVDLAAEAGGNCVATKPGESYVHRGVTIIGKFVYRSHEHAVIPTIMIPSTGYTDLPSRLPAQSSTLYSNNITKFLLSITPPDASTPSFSIDLDDEVVRGSIVLKDGELLFPPPKRAAPAPSPSGALEGQDSATAGVKMVENREITPWQKASREVALVTAGLGSMVALGAYVMLTLIDTFS